MKKPNKRGQCGKNALPKLGLTPTEEALVKRMTEQYRKAWEALLLRNKWRKCGD
jgi:hypothetical protein